MCHCEEAEVGLEEILVLAEQTKKRLEKPMVIEVKAR